MPNLTRRVFTANGLCEIPNGVKSVKVYSERPECRCNTQGRADGIGPQITCSDATVGVSMLVENGQVYAWGLNASGNLGINTITPTSSPTLVVGPMTFQEIRGGETVFAFATDGTLYSCGSNGYGTQGINSITGTSSFVAVQAPRPWKVFVAGTYSAGYAADHASFGIQDIQLRPRATQVYILQHDGKLYACGTNYKGSLGVGVAGNVSSPTLVWGSLAVAQVYPENENGSGSTFIITTSGDAYASGVNTWGRLGVGDTTPRSSPTLIVGGYRWACLMPDSANGTCYGISTGGHLYGWGINASGQLGQNDRNDRSSPVLIAPALTFSKVCMNGANWMGLTTTGQIWACGDNTYGQIGDSTLAAKSTPTQISGGGVWTNLWTDGNSVFGAMTGGDTYAWGYNAKGKLGNNAGVANVSSPVRINGMTYLERMLLCASENFFVKPSGDIYAVGGNLYGQCGVNVAANTPVSSPTLIATAFKWHKLFQLTRGACTAMLGITQEGYVYSWGQNTNGQLGDLTVVSRSSPVLVSGYRVPMLTYPQKVTTIAVTPGQNYNIIFGGQALFGSTPVGINPTKITVEYVR